MSVDYSDLHRLYEDAIRKTADQTAEINRMRETQTAAANDANRQQRIEEAMAKRETARKEAEATNREGFYRYGPEERQQRLTTADADLAEIIGREEESFAQVIDRVSQEVVDIKSRARRPLLAANADDRARSDFLRRNVAGDVRQETPAAIDQELGAALRASDRVLAGAWWEEIAAHVRELPDGNQRKRELELLADKYLPQLLDPDVARQLKSAEVRLTRTKESRQKFWDLVRATQVEAMREQMRNGTFIRGSARVARMVELG